MLSPQSRNNCQACLLPSHAEDTVVAHLLDRISELEDENANLRKLEETIRSNFRLFDALLRASHEGILLLSPELIVLRLVHSALGHSEQHSVGESVLSFVHPEDASLLNDCCTSLLNSRGETRALELRGLSADSNWTWLETHITDMLDDPNVQALVLNFRRIARPSEPS